MCFVVDRLSYRIGWKICRFKFESLRFCAALRNGFSGVNHLAILQFRKEILWHSIRSSIDSYYIFCDWRVWFAFCGLSMAIAIRMISVSCSQSYRMISAKPLIHLVPKTKKKWILNRLLKTATTLPLLLGSISKIVADDFFFFRCNARKSKQKPLLHGWKRLRNAWSVY